MITNPSDLIEGSVRISSLPNIFCEINEVVNDPYSSFADVANVISNDISLSARLLKIVNSSFYGFPSNIESIPHAVFVIGTKQLRELALATLILSNFKGIPDELVNMSSFWRHSVAVGIAARAIAIQMRQTNVEFYYLAGILHDVGRLIILENVPEQAKEIFSVYRNREELLCNAEKEVLGFGHGEVGSAVLETWNLPSELREIIAHHHDPTQSSNYKVECGIIHFADTLVKAMELGNSGDPFVPPMNPEVWNSLQIPTNQLGTIWNQIEKQYQETIEIFLAG